ncbi:hypothetical protein GJ496_008929 [Pomphorhynchus laevis]|nr:hypothetical protein GJ496_008929 [Pomphorhynchus laevis]
MPPNDHEQRNLSSSGLTALNQFRNNQTTAVCNADEGNKDTRHDQRTDLLATVDVKSLFTSIETANGIEEERFLTTQQTGFKDMS